MHASNDKYNKSMLLLKFETILWITVNLLVQYVSKYSLSPKMHQIFIKQQYDHVKYIKQIETEYCWQIAFFNLWFFEIFLLDTPDYSEN